MKTKQFNYLLDELSKCNKYTNHKCSKKSFIIFYKEKGFCKKPEINIDNYVIIPLCYPVAQIKKVEQLEQYKGIWKYI